MMITNCSSLQSMITNNSTVFYQFAQNINCTGVPFTTIGSYPSSTFMGTLDGQGFSIINFTIASSADYRGIFAGGNGCSVTNLSVQNINITLPSASFIGTLFGRCDNCSITNIRITTTSFWEINNIVALQVVGGVIGQAALGTTIINCTVENSIVTASLFAGGIAGSAVTDSLVANCHNLGIFANSSALIVFAASYPGGIVGSCNKCSLIKSGTRQGMIETNNNIGGGVVGRAFNAIELSQLYSKSLVVVNCNSFQTCGGVVGWLQSSIVSLNVSLNNIYSQANVSGVNYLGGLIGLIEITATGTNSNISISSSYSSSPIVNTSAAVGSFGSLIGAIQNATFYSLTFYQLYFDLQSSSYPPIGSGNSTDATFPVGFSPLQLLIQINSTFDQCSIWSANNLRIELNQTFQAPFNCSTTYQPTTQFPTTCQPTTQFPTTKIPTTQFPTTETPTTYLPTTQISTTYQPTTQILTTQFPTTQTPTTYVPTTQIPTTYQPSTEIPSTTLIPSTYLLTTFPTAIATSQSSLKLCFYQVVNCEKCSLTPIEVDLNVFNVSCSNIAGDWHWIFSNRTSGTLVNGATFLINGTTIFIEGNFTQTSRGTLVVVIDFSNYRNSVLVVSGCLAIDGKIELILIAQPAQGTTTINIISYNCTQQIDSLSSSQIIVTPTYKESKCDEIESQAVNNTVNTVSIAFTSSLGTKCNNPSKKILIIALSVGIPCALILLTIGSITFVKWKQKRDTNKFFSEVQQSIDGKKKNSQFVKNRSYDDPNRIKWIENNATKPKSVVTVEMKQFIKEEKISK